MRIASRSRHLVMRSKEKKAIENGTGPTPPASLAALLAYLAAGSLKKSKKEDLHLAVSYHGLGELHEPRKMKRTPSCHLRREEGAAPENKSPVSFWKSLPAEPFPLKISSTLSAIASDPFGLPCLSNRSGSSIVSPDEIDDGESDRDRLLS